VAQANTIAELRGWSPFVALQIEYSLVERTVERELTPMAAALGLPVLAWGPLAGGLLTGKYAGAAPGAGAAEPSGSAAPAGRLEAGDRRLTDRNHAIVAALSEVAADAGTTLARAAIAWLRTRRPATVIPILGARSADQLSESLAALELDLSPDHLARLDEASHVDLGFPYEFLARLRAQYGR
jgi:aryl-alcohol dehydrogenase-like predicted oxidoreductase